MNIILIILALHFLRTIIYKPKYTTLNCGIFAWAGANAKDFNKAKFDIQGLYNNSRGGDSCGVSTDGEIYYGINTSKNYGNFLVDSNYDSPELIPTVIGHTRKSSSGSVNANNAHPFGFGDYNESFEFVGVHNGTLHNQHELAKKYDVETSAYKFSNNNWIFDRVKIDSEILLECIYKNDNFNVLSDYIGGAALLFTNTMEPNILYAYRGASKLEKHGSKVEIDERPLFYYIENKNSVYLSSMEESLTAIGAEANADLFKLDENTVYRIVDGDIENAEKIVISRENAHQRLYVNHYNEYNNWHAKSNKKANKEKNSSGNESLMNIRSEKQEKFFPSDIYMQKLRYYRNGHLIKGIYTWISNYGFYKLCEDVEHVLREADSLKGRKFNIATGHFPVVNAVVNPSKDIIVPFKEGKDIPIFYMYDGVMLETELDYKVITTTSKFFSSEDLSHMSKHPVISVLNTTLGINDQQILYKGKKFTGNISPMSVNKIYYINDGNLMRTTKINVAEEVDETKSSTPAIQLPLPLNTANISTNKGSETSFIDQLIEEQIKEKEELNEKVLKVIETENSDCCETPIDPNLGREQVEDLMLPIYMNVQNANTKLKEFDSNPIIKNIIDTNNDYLTTLDEDIEKAYLK